MSKESEEAFDALQKSAIDEQKVMLYFCAVLPNGEAIQVTSSMLPESLEEIGPFPSLNDAKKQDLAQLEPRIERRGKKMAEVFNTHFNPSLRVLLEALIHKHFGLR